MSGKKGRSGPAKGNLNALKNGTSLMRRSSKATAIHRLNLGEMPHCMRRANASARAYRRSLEQLVMETKGKVSLTDAHWIDVAAVAEQHAAVCRWLLREKLNETDDNGNGQFAEGMSPGDIMRASAEVMKARETRNKAVERLKLDAKPADPWAVLDTTATVVDQNAELEDK